NDRGVFRLAFTADGQQVLSLDRSGRTLKFWDATRGPESRPLRCRASWHAAFSPDGRRVATAAQHATANLFGAVLWDVDSGQEQMKFGTPSDSGRAVAFSPDGNFLAAAVSQGLATGGVKIWDVRTGKLVRALPDLDSAALGPTSLEALR